MFVDGGWRGRWRRKVVALESFEVAAQNLALSTAEPRPGKLRYVRIDLQRPSLDSPSWDNCCINSLLDNPSLFASRGFDSHSMYLFLFLPRFRQLSLNVL